MDDKKLAAFLAAARSGSLSKAAAELGYTQSGLTQMMNSLEDELGCTLLVRGYNGVRLSKAGEQLLPYIEDAVSSLKRLREEAGTSIPGQDTPIRIGVFPSISKSWLPPVIKQYRDLFPESALTISVGGQEIPDWLESDIIDLAFVEESMRGNFRWLALSEDSYYAVVPADSPLSGKAKVTVDELSAYPFIMSDINELRSLLRPLLRRKMNEEIKINAVDDAALLSLVEQGLGVTILPELSLHGHSPLVRVLELEPPLKRVIGIAMPRSSRRHITEFADFVKNLMRNK